MNSAIEKNMTIRKRQGHILRFCLLCLMFVLASMTLFTSFSNAELKAMSEGELKTTTAQAGLIDFSLNKNTARLFLDIHIETYATIRGFSAGNYAVNNIDGWDQKWNDIQLGSASEPLVIDGLVFMADFEEGTLGVDPVLERVVIGSNRLQGTISALISRYTGIYSSALTNGGSPDTILNRKNLTNTDPDIVGTTRTEFNFDSTVSDKGLFLILNIDKSNFGIQVVAGYNETTIPTTATGPWWDSP